MNFFRSVLFVDPEEEDNSGEPVAGIDSEETAAAASAAATATLDFFKSVFSSDPEQLEGESEEEEEEEEERDQIDQQTGEIGSKRAEIDHNDGQIDETEGESGEIDENEGEIEGEIDGKSGNWGLGLGFGGLIKTFADKSGTVIRDLEEFGQGLKAETAVLRDVASKALDVGASAAQEKLESMGQVVDDLGDTFRQGTKEILSQSKEALLSRDSPSSPSLSLSSESDPDSSTSRPILTHLTRFESQMLAARSDPATFAEPPEDQSDFATWRLREFKIEERKKEIESLVKENSQLEVFLEKLVPSLVDEETFWSRYFYKVHKINLAESARAKIVKMAKKGDEDEDLSWEVEEEEEEEIQENQENQEKQEDQKEKNIVEIQKEKENEKKEKEEEKEEVINEQDKEIEGSNGESNGESKISEFSIVSRSQSQEEEEDLGWEAIEEESEEKKEDLSNLNNNLGTDVKVEDLRKRLSGSNGDKEEEEELSWDIEDE